MRVLFGEIGASNALGVTGLVVVPFRPPDIVVDTGGEGVLVLLGIGIRGVV
jgi:hypothetical protein